MEKSGDSFAPSPPLIILRSVPELYLLPLQFDEDYPMPTLYQT
jgi:hypothetical protein